MRITRQTPQQLVVEDSGYVLSAILLAFSLVLFYAATLPGKLASLFGACFMLLGAAMFFRKTQFIFDAGEQRVRWKGRKLFKAESGVLPFSDIKGIGTETSFGSQGSGTYRLTILTLQGPVPLAYTYGGNRTRYESIREVILQFLHLEIPRTPLPSDPSHGSMQYVDEPSIISLLRQGRKIDAIALVRSSSNLGLAEAKQVVDQIDAKMKTVQ